MLLRSRRSRCVTSGRRATGRRRRTRLSAAVPWSPCAAARTSDAGWARRPARRCDREARAELHDRLLEQRRIQVAQRLPVAAGEHDGEEVAHWSRTGTARVVLGELVMAGHGRADEEADVSCPRSSRETPIRGGCPRGEALGQHHVQAGDVEPAAVRNSARPQYRRRCAASEIVAQPSTCSSMRRRTVLRLLRKAPAEIAAEQVQPVVKRRTRPCIAVASLTEKSRCRVV